MEKVEDTQEKQVVEEVEDTQEKQVAQIEKLVSKGDKTADDQTSQDSILCIKKPEQDLANAMTQPSQNTSILGKRKFKNENNDVLTQVSEDQVKEPKL